LLVGETPREDCVIPVAASRPGIGSDEIRLHPKFVARNSAGYEFLFRKFRERDEQIRIGLPLSLRSNRQRYRRRCASRSPVATVADSPPHAVLDALFTDLVIANEVGRRTKQTIVMQSLHDRNSCFST